MLSFTLTKVLEITGSAPKPRLHVTATTITLAEAFLAMLVRARRTPRALERPDHRIATTKALLSHGLSIMYPVIYSQVKSSP